MMKFLGFFVSFALQALANPVPRSGTSTEDVTYILPIWEGALASHNRSADLAVLSEMKTRLGVGGAYTKLGYSFSSWALSRDTKSEYEDYAFDSTNLEYMLNLGITSSLPVLVHMNNGRWADCCTPNSSGGWGDALLDHIASQPNTVVINSSGASQYAHNAGNNYFSLSRLNTVYRSYKKRNVQASARVIAEWAASHPSMLAGVSLDSETLMPNKECDHNQLVIEEWKQWLQNTGIYGPGGLYFGAGRVPAFTDIASFNRATGQSFYSWDALQPPPSITPGNPFDEEWQRWRVMLVLHAVSDETLWIAEAGIDRNLIFGHQTPRQDDYGFADDVMTATAANGAGGITQYGWTPADMGEINNPVRGSGKNNWGNFELNPLSSDPNFSYNNILTLYNDGIKLICPNSWESDQASPDQYAIFNSPNFGDTFGLALNKFLSTHANTPRNIQPPPWNPGTKVYDFFDTFPTAKATGPDNHLESNGSVGNVIRKSVYSAVGGRISYTLTLPNVTGSQRLNFWTSVGIKDGAGIGGEVLFQVTFNGQNLFGRGFHLQQNYWVWKRWVPIMVDVTAWAGQNVEVSFITTGNDIWGWTTWGAPAVYASVAGFESNNLALGRSVSVSSSDGYGPWDARWITDGRVSGDYQHIGWSSIAHSSADATEWMIIDLGSSKQISKVVLFSRSDLVDFQGTGFPIDFEIQGAVDRGYWSTIVREVDFPGAVAGEGQIFSFVQRSVRYVRVLATKLGGVGMERGYRFQLGEVEVFE